jgi:chloramphenicol 3-O-phosphotransferase
MRQPVDDAGGSSVVIFLNGASSAGKTSIAKVLQRLLDEPSLHATFDSFIEMLPAYDLFAPAQFHAAFSRMVSGFHRALPALAATGLPLIVDHVLQEPEWLEECVAALADARVWFVGVHCPLAELERREQARGNPCQGWRAISFRGCINMSCMMLKWIHRGSHRRRVRSRSTGRYAVGSNRRPLSSLGCWFTSEADK